MTINLANKIALVTGATGHLGGVICKTLAGSGATLVIHYHKNESKARELCHELTSFGGRAMTVQADITNFDSVLQMRDQVTKELGAPAIIINNAVIQYRPWKEILEEDIKVYEHQFQSSVLHNVFMAKAFVPAMIKNKYGRVIGINSESSMQNLPGQSGYISGKRGMDGIMRVLAKEIGAHQITVNQVAPGAILDENEKKKLIKPSDDYAKAIPMKRRGTAQETANVVCFLASDLASFITGAYIPVCGGNVMPGI